MKLLLPCAFAASLALAFPPAVAATPASAADRALHRRLMVLDSHLDTPADFSQPGWDIMDRHDPRLDQSQVDYPRMQEGGLDGGFWAIFTSQGPLTKEGYSAARDAALVRALEIREMVARHHERFALAFRASDAEPILAANRKVVFQSIENSYPLGEDLTLLSTFYRLGVRMVGPVHFSNNQFADSATDPSGNRWNGLSPLGRDLVREANRLGMILDASHASDEVLDQMIDLSQAPIILSHTGVDAIYEHPRNIPDALMRKLAAKGGVIQINAFSSYMIETRPNPARADALRALNTRYGPRDRLTPAQLTAYNRERVAVEDSYPIARATFEDFMKHLLHAIEVVGIDHVGIGADWDGGGGLAGFEDITGLPLVTMRLRQAGYSEADLQKFWGANALRVLAQVEAVAENMKSARTN
jgi:membrane dipeptidase